MVNQSSSETISSRYLSLDVLRGLTVALMVVVNTPGNWSAIYAPLKHSIWNGFTPTDWVFPTFLFVVGNAMSFSMKKLSTIPASDFLKKVGKRTFIIFLIGLFLNAFPFFHYEGNKVVINNIFDTRLWGVMQRIAVCYGLGSLLVFYLNKKVVIIISVLILLAYWFLLHHFGDQPNPYSLEGNVIAKIDLLYLLPKNMYNHYEVPFDPLGLLSTLPAIINVIAGYLVGKFIQQNGNNLNTIYKMAIAGLGFILVAYLWDLVFPINKALWTSSYVICALGYDLLILASLMLFIEVWRFKKWTYFFEVFGRNPLFIYVLAWIVITLMRVLQINGTSIKSIVYKGGFTSWLAPINASLLFAITYMLLMWMIGYVMDKKKWYVKV